MPRKKARRHTQDSPHVLFQSNNNTRPPNQQTPREKTIPAAPIPIEPTPRATLFFNTPSIKSPPQIPEVLLYTLRIGKQRLAFQEGQNKTTISALLQLNKEPTNIAMINTMNQLYKLIDECYGQQHKIKRTLPTEDGNRVRPTITIIGNICSQALIRTLEASLNSDIYIRCLGHIPDPDHNTPSSQMAEMTQHP